MINQTDPEFMNRLDAAAAEIDPSKLLGSEVEAGGRQYVICDLIGAGAEVVVFGLKDIATGEHDQVLKVPRSQFDPQTRLQEILRDELVKGTDCARVIAVCDKLLSLFPNDDVAA